MRVAHPRRKPGGGSKNVHPAIGVVKMVSIAKIYPKVNASERERDFLLWHALLTHAILSLSVIEFLLSLYLPWGWE